MIKTDLYVHINVYECVYSFRCGHGAEGGDDPQRELARPGRGGAGRDDCV